MTWNDIEVKWAAMARRVGSDRAPASGETPITTAQDQPEPQTETTELRAPAPADRAAS